MAMTPSSSSGNLRRRLRSTVLTAVLAIAALTLALVGTASAERGSPPELGKLFERAVSIVHGTNRPTYAKARMLEADGAPTNGKLATSAADIVKWYFVLDNQPSESAYATATIKYLAGSGFKQVVGHRAVYTEDLVIPKAPKMTLEQAVARLRRAGQKAGFSAVVLRNPLGPSTNSKPLYVFTMANGSFYGVNTVTGKVAPLAG